jgi:hypothetical protein
VLILGGLASCRGSRRIIISGRCSSTLLDLPLSETRITSLRFIIVRLILIGLMAFSPRIFGKRGRWCSTEAPDAPAPPAHL